MVVGGVLVQVAPLRSTFLKSAGTSKAFAGIGAVETDTSSELMVISGTVPEGPVAADAAGVAVAVGACVP